MRKRQGLPPHDPKESEGRPRAAAPQLHQSDDGYLRWTDVKQMAHRKVLPHGHSQTSTYRNTYQVRNCGSCKHLILLASPTGFEPVLPP